MAAERFADEKYVSWLKVSLSLHFAKEGLETFTDDEVNKFHSNIHPGSSGSGVHTCNNKKKNNLNKQWQKGKFTCKADNCDKWLAAIKSNHDNPSSSVEWDNSDISQLSGHPWACAKLYMPYGCKEQNSAKDADIAALLTLYLHCTHFNKFFTNLRDCKQIKDIRNRTMHSSSMEVETQDMDRDTTEIIAFLKDPKHLLHVQGCKYAVENITKLLAGKMELSLNKELELIALHSKLRHLEDNVDQLMTSYTDLNVFYNDLSERVKTVEAGKASDDEKLNRIQSENQTMRLEVDSTKKQLSDVMSRMKAFDDFVTANDINGMDRRLVNLQERLDGLVDNVSKLEKRIMVVEEDIRSLKQKMTCVEEEIRSQKQKIKGIEEKLLSQGKTIEEVLKSKETRQSISEDRIKDIQEHLISLYNTRQTVPLYPLQPEWREHVERLFVIPNMVEINPRGVNFSHLTDRIDLVSGINRETKVCNIRSIFYSGKTLHKDIYLVGDSGKGKSTLCEYLVHLWVKAHSSDNKNVVEENFMENFTFLFFISLRKATSGDVEHMIADQIHIEHGDILKLLSDNKCLIILDGLDESPDIPARRHRANSTYITTSRPWKIELLRNKLAHLKDRHISITGLEWQKQRELAKKVLELLNSDKGRNKSVNDFFDEVKSKHLSEHMETPILLMQMLGIWFSGESFGRSRCDIYGKTVEMQLQFAEEIKDISEYLKQDIANLTTTQSHLPVCFKALMFCKKYQTLLLKLSKLAYQQLFSKNRVANLVFDHEQMVISGMNETEMIRCLKLGLLTQFNVIGELKQRLKCVSFVHKSHQEFFAAIHLSQTAHDSDLQQLFDGFCDLNCALEIEKMFTLVSGMNPSVSCEIASVIMQHVGLDPRIQHYRQSLDNFIFNEAIALVKQIQGVILAGIEEGKKNDVTTPVLQLHDIWMSNDDRDFPPSRILANTKSLDLSHVKSVFFYGTVAVEELTIWSVVNATLPNLQKLVLFDCGLSDGRVQETFRETSGDLQALGIYGVCSRLSQENLQKILTTPKRSLGIGNVTLTHEQMNFVCRHLKTRSFNQLILSALTCTEHGGKGECMNLDLSASSDIKSLALFKLPLQTVVFRPESLLECSICSLPEGLATDATRYLRRSHKLETLICSGYRGQALDELCSTLHLLRNLQNIILCYADLRVHEHLLFTKDLKKLKFILMIKVTLTADMRRLLRSLPSQRMVVALGQVDEGTVTIVEYNTDVQQQIRDNPDTVVMEDDVDIKGEECIIKRFCFSLKSDRGEITF